MRFRLPQKCVYWAPIAADAEGRPTLAAPVELACRWEDGVDETIDTNGDVKLSEAKVFLDTPALATGILMLGNLATVTASGFPASVRAAPGTHEILRTTSIPSLSASQTLYTAYVK